MARIYSISVSNAVDGVSSGCRACALSTQPSSSTCVPCPPGHYIDTHTSQCTECPRNTYLVSHVTPGPDACKPCGPASKSDKVCSWCWARGSRFSYDSLLWNYIIYMIYNHLPVFVFYPGPQFMLQRLSLQPHRGKRHTELWLRPPGLCRITDEWSELYLQRN